MMTMKTFLLRLLAAGFAAGGVVRAAGFPAYTVHEWGTFTTVNAPDGTLLPGLEREEERLPNFVHSHAGFAPENKGWSRPVANVTVKMETPVLYVYSPEPFRLRAAVDFVGGSISQWYPERVAGEVLPPAEWGSAPAPVDFSAGFHGSIAWEADVLAPGVGAKPAHSDWETPQWGRARVPVANALRGPDGEEEGFLFYRGVGNFALPLHLSFDAEGALRLSNRGAEPLPFVWIYDHREKVGARFEWSGPLAAGETRSVGPAKVDFGPDRPRALFAPLVSAGLSPAEAEALLATWRESYFEREGLRVFWIVPRALVDRVLPLRLEPEPARLERVLVGRSEVVTPASAVEFENGFRADGGAQWRNHRYFFAYRALAARRGVVSAAAAPTLPSR